MIFIAIQLANKNRNKMDPKPPLLVGKFAIEIARKKIYSYDVYGLKSETRRGDLGTFRAEPFELKTF